MQVPDLDSPDNAAAKPPATAAAAVRGLAWLGLCLVVCCGFASTVLVAGGRQQQASAAAEVPVAAALNNGSSDSRGVLAETAEQQPPMQQQPDPLVHWIREGSHLCLGGTAGAAGPRPATAQQPHYRWLKNGVVVSEQQQQQQQASLMIERARASDEGLYTLQQLLANGSSEASVSTWVRVARAPVVRPKPRCQMVVPLGSKLALSITADGLPPPTYQWKLNGVDIAGASRPEFVVPSVNASHMGTYTCEVSNMAGRAVWEEAVVAVGFF